LYESEILRRIFGLKKGELTGSWRKLYNEELVICAQIKEGEMGRVCRMNRRDQKCIQTFGHKTGKRLFRRSLLEVGE
jgi:hypothetical protein